MDINLSETRGKLIVGAIALVLLIVLLFLWRAFAPPPAPEPAPGQTLQNPFGSNAPTGPSRPVGGAGGGR